MFKHITAMSTNVLNAVISMPSDAKLSFASSLRQYKGRVKSNKVSLYTKALLLCSGILNTPKYTLIKALGMQNSPVKSMVVGLIYTMANPLSYTISLFEKLTPNGIKDMVMCTFSVINRCIFGPFKYLFKLITDSFAFSFRKLIEIFTFAKKSNKFIIDHKFILEQDQNIAQRVWGYISAGFKKIVNSALSVLGKALKWVYNSIEKVFLTAFMPIVNCIGGVLKSGAGQFAGLADGWANLLGVKGVKYLKKLNMKGMAELAGKAGDVWKTAGAAIESFTGATLLSGLGITFLNKEFISKVGEITSKVSYRGEQISQVLGVKNMVLDVYNLKGELDSLLDDVGYISSTQLESSFLNFKKFHIKEIE